MSPVSAFIGNFHCLCRVDIDQASRVGAPVGFASPSWWCYQLGQIQGSVDIVLLVRNRHRDGRAIFVELVGAGATPLAGNVELKNPTSRLRADRLQMILPQTCPWTWLILHDSHPLIGRHEVLSGLWSGETIIAVWSSLSTPEATLGQPSH